MLRELISYVESIEHLIATLPQISSTSGEKGREEDSVDSVLTQLSTVSRLELERLRTSRERVSSLAQGDVSYLKIIEMIYLQFVSYTWCRLNGLSPRISAQTRLSLWHRLWISYEWRWGVDQHLERAIDLDCLLSINAHLESINLICAKFRSDPLWNPRHVHERRSDFFAEESIAMLVSERSELQVTTAPLEADILEGLDLSVRSQRPKARGWLQVSMSGEEKVHRVKNRKLNRSAAISLLSPWTISELIHERARARDPVWKLLGINPSPSWSHENYAREIAQLFRSLLGVSRLELSTLNTDQQRVQSMLLELCETVIKQNLGQRAKKPYRKPKQEGLYELPLEIKEYFCIAY